MFLIFWWKEPVKADFQSLVRCSDLEKKPLKPVYSLPMKKIVIGQKLWVQNCAIVSVW